MKTSEAPPQKMWITPAYAEELLASSVPNRTIRTRDVIKYAEMMKNNEWKYNAETITVSDKGTLLNGQHRLRACIRANTRFQALVAFDVSEDAFDTIDIGRARTGGDVLSSRGCKNGPNVFAAYQWQAKIRRNTGSWNINLMSIPQVVSSWETDNSMELYYEKIASVKKLISSSLAAALYAEFVAVGTEHQADQFFEDLLHGSNLDIDDPIFILRNWLMDSGKKLSSGPISQVEKAGRCIRAWNHRRRGRKTKRLQGFKKDPDSKSFRLPDII